MHSRDGFAEVIEVRDRCYILAGSALADDRTRVLKHGETFAVFDRLGDVHRLGRGQQGVFHDGMRHLSDLELRIGGERPLLLSSTVTRENAMVAVDLTNAPLDAIDGKQLPHDSVHVFRSAVLWEAACHQRLSVRNYTMEPLRLPVSLTFAADFCDIFEIRGVPHDRSGEMLDPRISPDGVVLAYRGADSIVRCSRISFEPEPIDVSVDEARFELSLAPGEEQTICVCIACEHDTERVHRMPFDQAAGSARVSLTSRMPLGVRISTSNQQFDEWLDRSTADLRMLLTETPQGLYPYAGVPWFSTPFGRDGLVTALQTLWVEPAIAASVLRFLAARQAQQYIEETDAEPGKILHEARGGEMAAMGLVPFRRYYGTVDATPLFVILAHQHFERTADRACLDELWPHVVRALEWIDTHGDRDGDGFVEYGRYGPKGLLNQGWKDAEDSVFHADGELAKPPIALCEVQGYVYAAKQGAARLAVVMGESARADELRAQASELQRRFEDAFWCDELGTYALALDGQKRPCRVASSNAGHCLWSGIAAPERAEVVARKLLGRESFSGWGIRTLAESERRYNPMSYHNGSIWPHDNALIAEGLARYGQKAAVLRLFDGFFDAALSLDLHRVPELFCGFPRREGVGPTLYPGACAPQAWASAAVYLFLSSALGIRISAADRRVVFRSPALPAWLDVVCIRGLQVGTASVDIELHRHPEDVGLRILRRTEDVEVVVTQ